MVPHIVYGNDVGMVTEPSHSPSFAVDTGSGRVIQFLCLDEGKGHITVKEGIMGKIDFLLTALTEEFADLVTIIGEGSGFG
jgi:hypothetical protein